MKHEFKGGLARTTKRDRAIQQDMSMRDAEGDDFEAAFRDGTDDPLTDAVRSARRLARAGRLAEEADYADEFNKD